MTNFTEETIIDNITIDENKNILVRKANRVLKNGEIISSTFERYFISQGQDISEQPQQIQAIAQAIWN